MYRTFNSVAVGMLMTISLAAQQSTPAPSPSPSASPTAEPQNGNRDKPAKPKINAAQETVPVTKGSIEIVSDTMGVDFGPYVSWVKGQVQQHWYPLIPQSALLPAKKSGKVTISFSILKDGRIAGARILSSSGDVALDRAAYGAVTFSSPVPPLPQKFIGEYLTVRAHFFYNPDPEVKQPAQPSTETEKQKAEPAKKPAQQ